MLLSLFILNLVLKFFDIFFTYRIVKLGGAELNPIGAYLISLIGLVPAMVVLFLATTMFLLYIIRYWSYARSALIISAILHLIVVIWNLRVLCLALGFI